MQGKEIKKMTQQTEKAEQHLTHKIILSLSTYKYVLFYCDNCFQEIEERYCIQEEKKE